MTILRIDHNKPKKKKSKKQREIVWFNKSFTCTEFERGRTKLYSELFYCSQQRLLHWLSPGYLVCLRISFAQEGGGENGSRAVNSEYRGDRIVVEIVGAVLPLFTRRLSLEEGGTIVKTLPWWRKLALLLAEETRRGSPYPRSRIRPRISAVELRHFGPPTRSTVVIDAIKCFSPLRERNKTTAWLLNGRKQKVI